MSETETFDLGTPKFLYKSCNSLQQQPKTMTIISRSRLDAILPTFVTVHPHESSILLHSFSCFFFVSSPSHHTDSALLQHIHIILKFLSIGFLFLGLDLERVLCGASFAWWWCYLFGSIQPAGSLCGVLGAHFDCCTSFHSHFFSA